MSDHRVKNSLKSDHHALQNLSSNPTDKVTEFDSKLLKIFRGLIPKIFYCMRVALRGRLGGRLIGSFPAVDL